MTGAESGLTSKYSGEIMTQPLALLFPGQGSQELGMGRDLADSASPHAKEAMELWKKAERISGLPLRSIYWESNDAALMADTRNLQPALTVVNLNLWQAFATRLSAQPACTAGHSLGEYSALAAAGVLSLDATLELVTLRGGLMADADSEGNGAMAAVLKLDRKTVEDIVRNVQEMTEDILLVANYNTPTQFVISGTRKAVETASPLVKEHKGRAMPLAVSGAFHSPLMKQAAQELSKALDKATWNKPRFPVYSNTTGRAVCSGESLRELASRQMISSVLWIDTITNQWENGIRSWLEIGPKGVLSRMIKPILDALPSPEAFSVESISSLSAIENWK